MQRMDKLSTSQESIESTSSWVSLWRKEAKTVIDWWETYYTSAPKKKKLSLLYLANDVVQTSRQKGPEFVQGFLKVLPRAIAQFDREADDAGRKSIEKLIHVWQTRQVFGSKSGKFRALVEEESRKIDETKARSDGIGEQGGQLNEGDDENEKATPAKRQKRLPTGVDELVALMECADESYKKRISKEISYDQMHGSQETVLQAYKDALKDEMARRKAVMDYLECLLREEQSKYNGALGSLSVLPVGIPAKEDPALGTMSDQGGCKTDIQASDHQELQEKIACEPDQKDEANEASKIAAQVMNDPAALLELLGSFQRESTVNPRDEYDPATNIS